MQETSQNSNPQQVSEIGSRSKYFVTPAQAIERGISFREQPPKPETCQFCGKTVEPVGVALFGIIATWLYGRCDCEEAARYWADFDRDQKLKEEQEEKRRKYEEYISRCKQLLVNSKMGDRFKSRTFKNYKCSTDEERKCFEIAKNYADNFEEHKKKGDGLYFEGTFGTGKTHLAAAIAISLMSRRIPVIFQTCSSMLADIRRSYDDKSLSEESIIRAYETADLLVIDDLGKEQCTDWAVSVLYRILNTRYENMLPVIITTNYNTEDLVNTLSLNSDMNRVQSIISRLNGTSTVVTMVWEDYRKKHGE